MKSYHPIWVTSIHTNMEPGKHFCSGLGALEVQNIPGNGIFLKKI